MLTQAQIELYHRDGYLLVPDVLDTETVAELRQVSYEFVKKSGEALESDDVYDIGPGHSADSPRLRRLKHPHTHHPVYERVVRNPAIVDIVADLVGPAVRFDHSKLNYKPRDASGAIEWHQDWAFYPYTNDDMLAVGVLIEDVTEDNGPMMVVPGSHKGPIFDHHDKGLFVGALNTADDEFDASSAVTLTGKAGGITVHHVRTIHGSKENLTKNDRPFLVISYVAVDAWPLAQSYELEEFNSRILRGEPTLAPRQVTLPVRIPYPKISLSDSIYDDQDSVRGRSFDS